MAKKLEKIGNDRKKVLVICQHFWPESFRINDICDFFVERDCSVDVLCGIPNYPKGKFYDGYGYFGKRKEVHNGINIFRVLEIPRGNNSSFRIILNFLSFPFFSLFHLPRLMFRKYDKIFIYQLSPVFMSLPGIFLGKMKKIETIIYILDLWPDNLYSAYNIKNKMAKSALEKISYWFYHKADKIITISEKMSTEVAKITGISNKNVIFIPQVAEKIYEKDVYDENLINKFKGTFNLVYTGNISPAQDFNTILKALKKLKNNGIQNFRLIIVGEGMSKNEVLKTVYTMNLNKFVVFEGQKNVKEIPAYNTLADVLVGSLIKSPQLDCTIPAKVMSYFAAGRPMALAMDGEAGQLVNNIGCGIAVGSGDWEGLAESIKKIYSLDVSERKKMGEKGRKYHFENFERNKILMEMYNFIF